jgi:hypothetical protein
MIRALRDSFVRGNQYKAGLDAGDQTKVPITMQKRYAAKNRMYCYETVIRRTWGDTRPSASRI